MCDPTGYLRRFSSRCSQAFANFQSRSNVQLRRFFDEHIYTNAQMGPRHLRKYCVLKPECEKIMENAVTKLGFSARGYDRILKVARTIADLEGTEDLEPKHLSEAVQYRTLDRNLWV